MGKKVQLRPPWYVRLAHAGYGVHDGRKMAIFRRNWRYVPFLTIRFVRSTWGLSRQYLGSLWLCFWNTIKVVLPMKWRDGGRPKGRIIQATEMPQEVNYATKKEGR